MVGREEDIAEPDQLQAGRARRREHHRGPRPRRRDPRLLQRVPPPGHRGRGARVRQGRPLPVRLPRLDLRPRGQARPRQAHRGPRGLQLRDLRPARRSTPRPGRASSSSTCPRARWSRWRRSWATSSTSFARFDFTTLRVGQADRLRRRGELEVHRRELQRVLPLPGRPPAAQQADAVRPGRRLRSRRRLAGRLDGAGRRRRDDGARRRPRVAPRPPADVRHHRRGRAAGLLLRPLAADLPVDPPGLPAGPPARAAGVRARPGSSASGCSSTDVIATPDFDPTEPIEFWDLTNRQDWHVCELQQRGTRSRSWVAGRYSNNEPSVQAFDLMVADRYAGDPIVGRPTVRDHYGESPKPPANGHEHRPRTRWPTASATARARARSTTGRPSGAERVRPRQATRAPDAWRPTWE